MSRSALCAALLLVAGCGRVHFEPNAGGIDAGVAPAADAGSGTDAVTPPPDAGPARADAGLVPVDAGAGGVDAGSPGADAGVPGIDAGPMTLDAGVPAIDAGVGAGDAGIAHGCDAGAGMCDLTSYCRGRVAWTDNAYLPYDECIYQLDAARAACNADPLCALCGYTIVPTGVGGTQACADGGGMTGLRQWNCWPRTAIPMGQIPI